MVKSRNRTRAGWDGHVTGPDHYFFLIPTSVSYHDVSLRAGQEFVPVAVFPMEIMDLLVAYFNWIPSIVYRVPVREPGSDRTFPCDEDEDPGHVVAMTGLNYYSDTIFTEREAPKMRAVISALQNLYEAAPDMIWVQSPVDWGGVNEGAESTDDSQNACLSFPKYLVLNQLGGICDALEEVSRGHGYLYHSGI